MTFSVPVRAASVSDSDLPGAIQSCITATTCIVSNTSSYDSGTVSAFQIFQNTGGGYENNWLIRYALVPPSSGGGYLWMLAKNSYSASESAHPFTLYLDKISPTPILYFNDSNQNGALDLFMPSTDLLAGSSYVTVGLDSNSSEYIYGNLSGEAPPFCLTPGCEGSTRLNLVQLTYGDSGSALTLTAFNPLDTRGLVYTQSLYSPCDTADCTVNDVTSFYISAVPIPGAMWLFGSGLAGLIGLMWRTRGVTNDR
jgi:hypothetical protein